MEFLSKPESSMRVMLATADSTFYKESTEMMRLNSTAVNSAGLIDIDTRALVDLARDASKIEVRHFNTQMRLPLIIIDQQYCYVIVRLPPDDNRQSLRLEFAALPTLLKGTNRREKGFFSSCLAHFDKLWNLSTSTPKANDPVR
jgi:hypothetical protein